MRLRMAHFKKKNAHLDSGCVAQLIDTRDPRFESSHQQTLSNIFFIVNCVEKMKIKKKRPGIALFKRATTGLFFIYFWPISNK